MIVNIKIKNVPSNAKSWMPTYVLDGGSYSYDYTLPLDLPGPVRSNDIRVIIYTNDPYDYSGFDWIEWLDFDGVNLVDGETYVCDFNAGTLKLESEESSGISKYVPWVVAGAGVLVAAFSLASRK